MVQKAIVEKKLSKFEMRVRIPVYNKATTDPTATPTDQLYIAVAQTLPGCSPCYQEGDVVLVTFENDDISKPIISGLLYRDGMPKGTLDVNADSLKVNVNTELSEDTNIGNVQPESIKKLNDKYKNNIKAVKIEYALSTDEKNFIPVEGSNGEWNIIAPTREPKSYMWQRTSVLYENETVNITMTCISGADGSTVKITTVVEYAVGDNDTTPPETGWNSDLEQVMSQAQGKYLWTRTTMSYSNDSEDSVSYQVTFISGEITDIITLYCLSNSNVEPLGEWSEEVPNWDTMQFIWIRQRIVYADGTYFDTDPVLHTVFNNFNDVLNAHRQTIEKNEYFLNTIYSDYVILNDSISLVNNYIKEGLLEQSYDGTNAKVYGVQIGLNFSFVNAYVRYTEDSADRKVFDSGWLSYDAPNDNFEVLPLTPTENVTYHIKNTTAEQFYDQHYMWRYDRYVKQDSPEPASAYSRFTANEISFNIVVGETVTKVAYFNRDLLNVNKLRTTEIMFNDDTLEDSTDNLWSVGVTAAGDFAFKYIGP